MKTMLVPVDFTSTTNNAVDFAASWAKQFNYGQIILFKSFYESIFEFVAVASDYMVMNKENLNRQREESQQQLEDLRKDLSAKAGNGIFVTAVASELPLLRGIFELIKTEPATELVLLGSDHHTGTNNSPVAEQIISIAKASPVKVLIVPSDYNYQPIKNVLVPCDVKTLTQLDKLDRIKNNSKLDNAKLIILNVDTSSSFSAAQKDPDAADRLHAYLKDYPHEIHYTTDNNVLNGIFSFIDEHPVELIMALPGKHSFLYYLANKSISEAIYRNARQPVLILK